jgi:LysM repeat protein
MPSLRQRPHGLRRAGSRSVLALVGGAAVAVGTVAPPPATAGPAVDRRTCAAAGALTYTVTRGDSWSLIARAAGVKTGPLYKLNGTTQRSALHPGDVVCLPADARPPTTRAQSASTAVNMTALPAHGPCWFGDTWHHARANGRRHEGVDLLAQAGQYIYAVTDGTLTKRAWDQPGSLSGNAWWLTAADGSGTYYFYAHLSGFAEGLKVGSKVKAGEIIGFLGETGSAAAPHLHFEIHPGGGGPVNPYWAVKAMGGCRKGSGYTQPNGWTPSRGGLGG